MAAKDILQKTFEVIRDETGIGANTAERIGNAFLALLSYVSGIDKAYLSKTDDDTAAGIIDFLKGLRIKGLPVTSLIRSVDDISNADDAVMSVKRLLLTFLRKDQDDSTPFSLGVGQSLTVGDRVGSNNFQQGTDGWRIWRDDIHGWTAEVDTLNVRQVMNVYELLVNKIRSIGGAFIISKAAGKIASVAVTDTTYDITFESDSGFIAKNLMRCQVFTGTSIKSYWVEVTASSDNGRHISVSKTDVGFYSGAPAVGDECVLLGDTGTDSSARSAIIISVQSGYPQMLYYYGITSRSLSGCLIQADGYLGNLTDSDFGDMSGYGSYSQNVYLKGRFWLHDHGDADSALNNISEELRLTANDLQAQIDGQITSYFYDYTPTLDNIPASEWTSAVEKVNHVGDLFYNSKDGKAYRFQYNSTNSIYEWVLIQDTDVVKALALANTKGAVFYTASGVLPAPPYNVNDIWCGATYKDKFTNDLARCVTSRASGDTPAISDWVLANSYSTADYQLTKNNLLVVIKANSDLTNRVTHAESSISANAEAITTKVAQTDYDTNNTKISERFSTIEQTADKISLKVDNIAVGGRNLIVYSRLQPGYYRDGSVIADTNNVCDLTYIECKPNESFVASVYKNPTPKGGGAHLEFYDENKKYIDNSNITIFNDGEVFKKQFNSPDNAKYLRLGICYLENKCKIERGSIPTDYTAAPEDDTAALLSTGIDIENKKITVTADDFLVLDNSGKAIALFTHNDAGVPVIKTANVNADEIIAAGIQTKTIDALNAIIDNLTINHAKVNGDLQLNILRYTSNILNDGILACSFIYDSLTAKLPALQNGEIRQIWLYCQNPTRLYAPANLSGETDNVYIIKKGEGMSKSTHSISLIGVGNIIGIGTYDRTIYIYDIDTTDIYNN